MKRIDLTKTMLKGIKHYLTVRDFSILGEHFDSNIKVFVCEDEEDLVFVIPRAWEEALPDEIVGRQERGEIEVRCFPLMQEYVDEPLKYMRFDVIDLLMNDDSNRGLLRHSVNAFGNPV